jgi:hypothetical protein
LILFISRSVRADPFADRARTNGGEIETRGLGIFHNSVAEKRALQACVLLAAAVPVAAGLASVAFGPGAVELPGLTASQDSHARYLSGLLLGIGLAFWSTVPGIERRGARFRLLAAIVVLGGVARLLSLVVAGEPSAPMLGGLALELVATPLLALWQARVAARAALDSSASPA